MKCISPQASFVLRTFFCFFLFLFILFIFLLLVRLNSVYPIYSQILFVKFSEMYQLFLFRCNKFKTRSTVSSFLFTFSQNTQNYSETNFYRLVLIVLRIVRIYNVYERVFKYTPYSNTLVSFKLRMKTHRKKVVVVSVYLLIFLSIVTHQRFKLY